MSGKRLPNGPEWILAANGTNDGPDCNTTMPARATDSANLCTSHWGAQDMIGNYWEWTADWDNTSRDTTGTGPDGAWQPALEYNNDRSIETWGCAQNGDLGWRSGLPEVLIRGGSFNNGTDAGIFAIPGRRSAAFYNATIGFRCLLER